MNWRDISGEEEHPILVKVPPVGFRWLTEKSREPLVSMRRQLMVNEFLDTLNNGFELGIWELADKWRALKREKYPKGVVTELNLGGNRSAKSERAAKRV